MKDFRKERKVKYFNYLDSPDGCVPLALFQNLITHYNIPKLNSMAGACPSIYQAYNNRFVVRSPIDLKFKLNIGNDLPLKNESVIIDSENTSVDVSVIKEILEVDEPLDPNFHKNYTIQLRLGLFLIVEDQDNALITLHDLPYPIENALHLNGTFNIGKWTRPINTAFAIDNNLWFSISKGDIVLDFSLSDYNFSSFDLENVTNIEEIESYVKQFKTINSRIALFNRNASIEYLTDLEEKDNIFKQFNQ
tara:strand:- start:411 stop:1157 length:747 start_codon:yes stop_codon:yes gene_type:complete